MSEFVRDRINDSLTAASIAAISADEADRFHCYLTLLLKWNARINLTAVRDPETILSRHFVESIAAARSLPVEIVSVLDLGSGAGFPGLPIAIVRPDIHVTLVESQSKKAAFLQECVRELDLRMDVFAKRAEFLQTKFPCVTLRAVDRMESAVKAAADLVNDQGWLVVLSSHREQTSVMAAAGDSFNWQAPRTLPGSESRILMLGQKLQ